MSEIILVTVILIYFSKNTRMFLRLLVHVVAKGSEVNETTMPGAKEIVKYEAMLVADILGNYSKNMRPVVSSKMPAIIRFAFQLNKLVTLVCR